MIGFPVPKSNGPGNAVEVGKVVNSLRSLKVLQETMGQGESRWLKDQGHRMAIDGSDVSTPNEITIMP